VIEPPDILLIDAVSIVPRPPFKIQPGDSLLVQLADVLPGEPVSGVFSVEPEGTINLGPSYGSYQVAGLTLAQARVALERQLRQTYKDARATLSLSQSRAVQQIRGEHLVRPDGTVGLGVYGSVPVRGLTLDMAKAAIEAHLGQFLLNPQVSVDVLGYNSKVYYVITDGGGYGEQVYRIPVTGNETVLDALGQIYGLPVVASKHRIWIARPTEGCAGGEQVLTVDWIALTRCGRADTNYQILPGDRIYVQAQPIITVDTYLARLLAPVERLFGVVLLGSETINSVKHPNSNQFGN
jgi:polysaccharide export outer membrane protein